MFVVVVAAADAFGPVATVAGVALWALKLWNIHQVRSFASLSLFGVHLNNRARLLLFLICHVA